MRDPYASLARAVAMAETSEERAEVAEALARYYSPGSQWQRCASCAGRAGVLRAALANYPTAEATVAHLNTLIKLVEATGSEMGLTVLVSGTPVTGVLTPWPRYTAWFKEVTMRTMHEGGRQQLPDVPMGPISAPESERVRADYEAELRDAGHDPDDTPEFPQFAMRDVTIQSGMGATWVRVPYLVVNSASVDAFFPAVVGEPA